MRSGHHRRGNSALTVPGKYMTSNQQSGRKQMSNTLGNGGRMQEGVHSSTVSSIGVHEMNSTTGNDQGLIFGANTTQATRFGESVGGGVKTCDVKRKLSS